MTMLSGIDLDQKMKIHVHKKTSLFKDLNVQDLIDLRVFDLTYDHEKNVEDLSVTYF